QARADAAKKVFPGQQHFNNCGIQSSAQIIGQATGKRPDEIPLLASAIENKLADSGGVTAPVCPQTIPQIAGASSLTQNQRLLAAYSVPSTVEPYSRQVLANAIWQQKGVIAEIDVSKANWWQPPASGGHAVVVTDGDFDK